MPGSAGAHTIRHFYDPTLFKNASGQVTSLKLALGTKRIARKVYRRIRHYRPSKKLLVRLFAMAASRGLAFRFGSRLFIAGKGIPYTGPIPVMLTGALTVWANIKQHEYARAAWESTNLFANASARVALAIYFPIGGFIAGLFTRMVIGSAAHEASRWVVRRFTGVETNEPAIFRAGKSLYKNRYTLKDRLIKWGTWPVRFLSRPKTPLPGNGLGE